MPGSLASRLPGIVARSTRPRSTLGLCMLLRDEAPLLPRCIDSVRPFIDSWTIVDTVSPGGTRGLVAELLGDLPGQLHERPWRDFGSNRTELLELAAGTADYLLLLDADQTVSGTPVPSLTADAYLLRQLDEPEMWHPCLIREGLPWRFVGSTHEELSCEAPYETKRLGELVVRGHPDGGASTDELERDLAWLERDLRDDPQNTRTAFYLAQTYRDLGRDAEAIELYARCAEEDAWYERAFYAAVQAGALTARTDPEAAIPLLLSAWGRLPGRVEPLYHLAGAARRAGQAPMALMAAGAGDHLPLPDDGMFVHRWMYEWGIRLELALALAGVGFRDEALGVVDELLGDSARTDALVVDALCTRQLLIDEGAQAPPSPSDVSAASLGAVPMLADLTGGTTSIGLGTPDAGPPRPGNPSIGIGPEGFAVAIPAASRVFLQVHGADGTPVSLAELQVPDAPGSPAPVLEFQDARVVWWRAAWHLVAHARDVTAEAVERMVLLRVEGERLVDLVVLAGEEEGRRDGSWMPFVVGDTLRFVSRCAPFVVVEWDPAATVLREVVRWPARPELADLRGGSQGVPFEDGHLFVVHQVHSSASRRLHSHRVLRTDVDHRPVALSPRFALHRYGVEVCAGLAPWGDDVLLSYGTQDQQAWLMSVPAEDLLGLLQPLTPVSDLADPGGSGLR